VKLDAARSRQPARRNLDGFDHQLVFTRWRQTDSFHVVSARTTGGPLAVAPTRPAPTGAQPPNRIVIQYPSPAVDGGRFAVKNCVGDVVPVSIDLFRDGHEALRAVVRYRGPGEQRWREEELRPIDEHLGGIRWAGRFRVDRAGRWEYTIEAWTDLFGTWREELRRKVAAGQHELVSELSEGSLLLESAVQRSRSERDRRLIEHVLAILGDDLLPEAVKLDMSLGAELFAAVERSQERHGCTTLPAPLTIEVDRVRARFGSWYELFPRSWGGLKGVEEQIPRFAELGFDVLYLPPIHPIGRTNRKGRDNALVAAPTDPGSPWAIGDETGGHGAIHRDLGSTEDLRSLIAVARAHAIDICLDFAIQCSADHPWLHEHPEWFHRRPDGTLKYAENPPKRYQDIYNVNWESSDWQGLWEALLRVVLHWVACGVRVFRVDNPHTKPLAFWTWLIEEVHARDRDVIFLAEAFTRRAVMRELAKIGFSQSYTYFTWKNSRHELTEYVSELAHSGEQEYFRPNFFTNTPDILHAYLQHGGRSAFEARLILAATLSPSYGIYSGFENVENVAVHERSEEYLHSEKYELKRRTLDGELLPLIARINHIRRDNPALQEFPNVTFLETANEALIAYAKQSRGNTVIVAVNIDPFQAQEGLAIVPDTLGLPDYFVVHDMLSDERYQWRRGRNFVRLVPRWRQAHVLRVEL
jgi:starch synthase (maltosyl-transferring)